MSFPGYDEYKDSRVCLVGEIPTHWDVWKLAHAFTQIGSGTTPKSDKAEYYDGGTIPWVNTGDLDDGPLTGCAKQITEKAAEDHSTLKLYPAGSLLFAMYGATIGKLGMLDVPATVNQACCVFSGESPITVKFLFYWFLGLRQKILSLATGGGQPNVSQDILRTLRVACPDKDEQRAISSFLDIETSKIDALVSEQRRLTRLLKEKRQAVISHAVTKGLNPGAPMKPSGIQWIGDVPQDWEIGAVKRFFESLDGRRIPLSSEERSHRNGDFPYYGASGIIDSVDDFIFDENLILVSEDGANLLNRSSRIAFVATGKYWVNNHAHILKPSDENLHYWAERIESVDLVPFVTGSAQPKFTADALMNLKIAVPPTESERGDIQTHFLSATEKLDTLLAETERAIELLQERRTALISAAVTGKIDVREFAYQETA